MTEDVVMQLLESVEESMSAAERRSERSRQALMQALVGLLEDQDYRQIRVTDIVERAGIARPTFYLHFKSKDELLLGYADDMFNAFYDEIEPLLSCRPFPDPEIGAKLFHLWQKHPGFARIIMQPEVEPLILKRLQHYISRVIGRLIRSEVLTLRDPLMMPYVIDFLAGASLMIFERWIREGFPHGAETMGALYAELARPGLLALCQPGPARTQRN